MKKLLASLLLCAALCSGFCNTHEIISIYFDDALLIKAREAVAVQDPRIMPHYKALKEHTDKSYLNMENLSIVDDKIHTAPSGDPKDYISLSPYWWPDPKAEGGVPYIRKDGVRNPEVYEYHERRRGELFGRAVHSLSLLYYISREERYAAKAAELIRTWFLDPQRGMNPNMTYAQHVPGMKRIRGTGIIDSRNFMTGINAAQIISQSKAWSNKDERELKAWAASYAAWLEQSINGKTESKSKNNHGLWYETIREVMVMYTGEHERLRDIIVKNQLPRIDSQVAEDGSMPHEIARTLGLHYTTFSLEALNLSDIMAQKVGVDVWGYIGAKGQSMDKAIQFVLPYYQNPKSWAHKQIKPFQTSRGAVMLYHAGERLQKSQYTNLSYEIIKKGGGSAIEKVLYFELFSHR